MTSNEILWEVVSKDIKSLEQTLSMMSDKELTEYALGRDHCQPLERELAERLSVHDPSEID